MALLITPHLVALGKSEQLPYKEHRSIDSATLGGLLANRWNLYTFGIFNMQGLMRNICLQPPTSFHQRYCDLGLECREDSIGFAQVFNIPHSMGKEIHIVDDQGQWQFGRDSQYQGMPHKNSLNNAWRWPIIVTTGNVPAIGQRLALLGGLAEFQVTPTLR